jgi:hypothetical protein
MHRSWGHASTGFGSARPSSMARAPSMDLTIIFPWKGRVCIRRPTDLQPFLTIEATKLLAVHGDIFTADRDLQAAISEQTALGRQLAQTHRLHPPSVGDLQRAVSRLSFVKSRAADPVYAADVGD